MYYQYYHLLSIGEITVCCTQEYLTEISYGRRNLPNGENFSHPILEKTKKELEEYMLGKRTQFSVPFYAEGTEFQKKVWAKLCEIPYGQTRSYGQVATEIGNPKASRAVGMANNRNPISIIIPCHRVIGANGKLVGYGGGLSKKQLLLAIEQQNRG